VNVSQLFSRSKFYVGKYDNILIILLVNYMYSVQDIRILSFGFWTNQSYGLVTLQAFMSVNRDGAFTIKPHVLLGSYHKLSTLPVNLKQSLEVNITPVHVVDSTGLNGYIIENVDVVYKPVSDMNKYGYRLLQVHDGVHLNGTFGTSKVCPRKQRQAQIDGGGIQGEDLLSLLQSMLFVVIEFSSLFYENECQFLIHLQRSGSVGVGKSTQGYFITPTHVISIAVHSIQSGDHVTQTVTEGQLSKAHGYELNLARELTYTMISIVSLYYFSKVIFGNNIHKLSKDCFFRIHRYCLIYQIATLFTSKSYEFKSIKFQTALNSLNYIVLQEYKITLTGH
jgi:hypothetical protein